MLRRKENKIIRVEASVLGDVDKNMIEELSLIIKNTRSLYNQTRALVDNLVKKVKKGTDLDLDKLANSSVVDQMIRDASKEYTRLSGERAMLSTATRKAAKQELAEYLLDLVEDELRDR